MTVGTRARARPSLVGETTHQWMINDVARLRPGFARVSRGGHTVSGWTAALCILCSLVPIPIIGELEPEDGATAPGRSNDDGEREQSRDAARRVRGVPALPAGACAVGPGALRAARRLRDRRRALRAGAAHPSGAGHRARDQPP